MAGLGLPGGALNRARTHPAFATQELLRWFVSGRRLKGVSTIGKLGRNAAPGSHVGAIEVPVLQEKLYQVERAQIAMRPGVSQLKRTLAADWSRDSSQVAANELRRHWLRPSCRLSGSGQGSSASRSRSQIEIGSVSP